MANASNSDEKMAPAVVYHARYTYREKVGGSNQSLKGHARRMGKKILYVDMDNVLVDFTTGLRHYEAETLRVYEGRWDEIPGIFSNMQAVSGAIEAYTLLCRFFDTYILSTAPWENPSAWSDKLRWVKTHLGHTAYKRLILTHHKHLNVGDYLIDDRLHNGADRFSGELIHFASEAFPNWQAVVDYLIPARV